MIDTGHGLPIVMIPGIQGRWEWMQPAIRALSETFRVFSFSLAEVPADPDCFNHWEALLDRLFERTGLETATLVGVSFGGLIAARYAARHPGRVRGLVLVSSPAPTWRLDDERAGYLERPLRSAPAFTLRAIRRLLPEVAAARPTWRSRIACLAGHTWRILRHPASPIKMAAWIRAWQGLPDDDTWHRITVPTLVITGAPDLDRVVPTSTTLEYLKLIPGAYHRELAQTGHIGLVSRPEEFAGLVGEFVTRGK